MLLIGITIKPGSRFINLATLHISNDLWFSIDAMRQQFYWIAWEMFTVFFFKFIIFAMKYSFSYALLGVSMRFFKLHYETPHLLFQQRK